MLVGIEWIIGGVCNGEAFTSYVDAGTALLLFKSEDGLGRSGWLRLVIVDSLNLYTDLLWAFAGFLITDRGRADCLEFLLGCFGSRMTSADYTDDSSSSLWASSAFLLLFLLVLITVLSLQRLLSSEIDILIACHDRAVVLIRLLLGIWVIVKAKFLGIWSFGCIEKLNRGIGP